MIDKDRFMTFLNKSCVEYTMLDFEQTAEECFTAKIQCKLPALRTRLEECQTFLRNFSSFSSTNWIVLGRRPSVQRLELRKLYVCQHSPRNKEKQSSRNLLCRAKVDFKFKKINRNTIKNDALLRTGQNVVINFDFNHSHRIHVSSAYGSLRCDTETQKTFETYFQQGMTVAVAKRHHDMVLSSTYEGEELVKNLANAQINPSVRQIHHIYENWRKNIYDGGTENDIVSKLVKACPACWTSARREAQPCDQRSNRPGLSDPESNGDLNIPESLPLPQQNNHTPQLEQDMENYMKYKIMGSVKRIQLKPHCIPSKFNWDSKHTSTSNVSHLAKTKRRRISESKDSVQDHTEEDNVKASSSCIEGSQTALDVPCMEHKCDKAVEVIQVQQQVVLSRKQKAIQNEDFLQSDVGNEIKVFCPKCNAEISHTAEGIQEDQIKIVIAKVYHYFEKEYEELKKSFDGLEQTLLSKFGQRTALATGVSETTVDEILQEEARRNAEAREEPSPNESRARKRPWQTDTEREQTIVVKKEPAEEPTESYNYKPEIYVEMAEVKDEPGVSETDDSLADPISIDIKAEPWNEEATSSNDTPVVQSATNKRKMTKRNTEVQTAAFTPPTPIAPPSPPRRRSNDTPVVQSATKSYKRRKTKQNTAASTVVSAPPTRNAPPGPPRLQNLLIDDGDIKMEQIGPDEGFS